MLRPRHIWPDERRSSPSPAMFQDNRNNPVDLGVPPVRSCDGIVNDLAFPRQVFVSASRMRESAQLGGRDRAPFGLLSLHGELAADSTSEGASVVSELFAEECEPPRAE